MNDLSDRLLSYLNAQRTGIPFKTNSYRRGLKELVGGNDALVYYFELEDVEDGVARPLVLRVPAASDSPSSMQKEALVQRVLSELGFLTPHVHVVELESSVVGNAFVVMDFVDGRQLSSEFAGFREGLKSRWSAMEFVSMVVCFPIRRHHLICSWAEALVQLQKINLEQFTERFTSFGGRLEELTFDFQLNTLFDLAARISADWLSPCIHWLTANAPSNESPQVICHGDLHPMNILVKGKAVSGVVDWHQAVIAGPEFDLADAVVTMTTVPTFIPMGLDIAYRLAMIEIANAYVRRAKRHIQFDRARFRYYQIFCCFRQLVWVAAAQWTESATRNPYQSPEGIRRLVSFVRKNTGLRIQAPKPFA